MEHNLDEARRLCPPTHRVVPVLLDNGAVEASLMSTAAWLAIQGSALTVNREKMKRRWAAILKYFDDKDLANAKIDTMRRLVYKR